VKNWTPERVEQRNRIQRAELDGGCTCRSQQGLQGHPHTCPNRSIMPHHDNGREIGCLLATKDGWVCPDCGYTEGVLHDLAQETLSATDIFALGA
jgi:ribosomal protein S27AE